MKAKKKTSASKARSKKPKVRKETIRDLPPKRGGKSPRGGWGPRMPTYGCATADCPGPTVGTICAVLI